MLALHGHFSTARRPVRQTACNMEKSCHYASISIFFQCGISKLIHQNFPGCKKVIIQKLIVENPSRQAASDSPKYWNMMSYAPAKLVPSWLDMKFESVPGAGLNH